MSTFIFTFTLQVYLADLFHVSGCLWNGVGYPWEIRVVLECWEAAYLGGLVKIFWRSIPICITWTI